MHKGGGWRTSAPRASPRPSGLFAGLLDGPISCPPLLRCIRDHWFLLLLLGAPLALPKTAEQHSERPLEDCNQSPSGKSQQGKKVREKLQSWPQADIGERTLPSRQGKHR